MTMVLRGLDGSNPLGFLAAMGLLRLIQRQCETARLGFLCDGTFHAFVEGFDGDVAEVIARDAKRVGNKPVWFLEYEKQEKNRTRVVADLKSPPAIFAGFLTKCVHHWSRGDDEAAAYAAAFGTSVAIDSKGNTKPTAFHFTAAQQQFLGAVRLIRASVTLAWIKQALFEGDADQPGPNLRWDPAAERNWALMANNPSNEGTRVSAPLEWLAFRGLPLFPTFPIGTRIVTTAISGRGEDMQFSWPLWSCAIDVHTARSVLTMPMPARSKDRLARGIFATCASSIRRSTQGFGNFGPSTVVS